MTLRTQECPYCGKIIKAQTIRCRFCTKFLDGRTQLQALGDTVGQDKIHATIGDNAVDVAVGKRIQQAHTGDVNAPFIQAQGNVTLGKSLRDEQYEIAVNWDKNPNKPRMRGFDLAHRDLSDLPFIGADFKGANLSYADLTNVNLREAILSGAKMNGANLSNANLYNANLSFTDFGAADLNNAKLNRANLREANLGHTNLFRADLRTANMIRALLHGTKVNSNTNLPAKWRLVWEIVNQKIQNPSIRAANVIRLDFSELSLSGDYLVNVDLSGANLSYADLSGDDLSGASLQGAKLNYANLYMACLEGANLYEADLTGVDLTRADLAGANLRGANLSYADLEFTDLTGIKEDSHTKWPEGFMPSYKAVKFK